MFSCQKPLFSLPRGLHYLNCAYMAPMARPVEEAGIEGIRRKRNPSAIGPADFFAESERVRSLFGRLIHSDPSAVALIPSASYGIAAIASNLVVERGDRIVVLEEQFPSNVYAWRRVAEETGASVVTVGPRRGGAGRAADWNEQILEAIDRQTAVVAMPNVHWTDGTRFDLVEISARAREVGAALVVDGTQSVGALPFDVRDVQPDALICAGYKWLLGPYAIGLAYFSERHHGGRPLEENWIARRHSERFSGLVAYEDRYQPGAVRYDVGERSNFILLPMMAAALALVLHWGPPSIQSYCEALMRPLIDEAEELGFQIETPTGRGHHLMGLRVSDGTDLERLRLALAQHNVSLSMRGSAVRISPHVYNDEQDVEALIDALHAAATAAR